MNNFINIPINAVKSIDSLLQHFKEETVDEVESSIKSLKRNFKAGNYLAIATLFIIIGVASILSQIFIGNYFLQAMTYFSMALLCLISFGLIIWRILKWQNIEKHIMNLRKILIQKIQKSFLTFFLGYSLVELTKNIAR